PFAETPNGKVTYIGLKTTRYRFNLGPNLYDTGIPTIFPPVITPPIEINTAVPIVSVNGPIYPSFAPTTDSDSNDIAGARLADFTVPLATYTGWGCAEGRKPTMAANRPDSSYRSPRPQPLVLRLQIRARRSLNATRHS